MNRHVMSSAGAFFSVFFWCGIGVCAQVDVSQGVWHRIGNVPECAFFNPFDDNAHVADLDGRCEGGRVQGEAVIIYDNNYGQVRYSGIFTNGILNGEGKLTLPHIVKGKLVSISYSGNFKAGVFDGHGTLRHEGTGVFSGEFKNGFVDGEGIWDISLGHGMRLAGTFHGTPTDFEIVGMANVEVFGPGGYRYSGDFMNNDKHGYGIQEFTNKVIYEGYYKDGWREGKGNVKLPNGNSCAGNWKRGQFVGMGEGILDGERTPCYIDSNQKMFFITEKQ